MRVTAVVYSHAIHGQDDEARQASPVFRSSDLNRNEVDVLARHLGEVLYLDSSKNGGMTVPQKVRLDGLNEHLAYGAGGGT